MYIHVGIGRNLEQNVAYYEQLQEMKAELKTSYRNDETPLAPRWAALFPATDDDDARAPRCLTKPTIRASKAAARFRESSE